ncbi:scarecrow-like protein 6 [Nymphaea colorata]|uniref:Uncharacterized protein n=1 Tax=Nymphaea colorata TaxID=210225 RepID=A0A5K0YLH8_9MAGN|nr:scarecrow-like protein 6 [Nymphaea colorata]VVV79001.1 unnamed protein product [Nymphaea colorata]
MKGMPFNFGGKGVSVPVPEFGEGKWKKVNNEPTSVLDTHRSPSPTSTSTLSSSFGGGGGGSSTDTAGGVAAISGHQPQKWAAAGEPTKDEWPVELVGSGKCGVAMDEWDNMMIETVGAPEPQDNSLFRWMVGEMEDPLRIPQGGGSANQVNGVGGGSCGGGGGGCGGTVSFDGPVEPGFSVDSTTYGFGASFIDPSCNGVVFPVNSLLGGFSSASKFGACSGGGAATSVGAGNVSLFAPSTNLSLPLVDLPGIFCQQQPEPPLLEEKPHIHPFINSAASNLGFYLQEVPVIPPAKRHQSAGLDQEWAPPPPSQALPFPPLVKQEMQIPHPNKVPFSDSGQELFLRPHKLKQQQQPMSLLQQHQQQRPRSMPDSVYGPGSDDAAQLFIVDQLHRAAELAETGNSVHARAILARLNHHLSSPVGKPPHRAAFYFKEALFHVLGTRNGAPPVQGVNPAIAPPVYSPSDVVLRIGAYKAFCEISPLVQFASLTCNQALLEILNGPSAIHILDFDIGIGGHWASFMQEIAPKVDGTHSLKITAFISPSSHNELELALTKENLSNFARLLNIPFEFNAVILDSFDPSVCNLRSPNQVLVANLPVSSHRFFSSSSLPSLLQFVRQLSPKLVVSSDNACDRTDLPFSQHFLNGLQFYSFLFDSLDAMNVNPNTLRKVEGLLLKPKIESLVASWYHAAEKLPPWRNLFISAGFTPVALSNYTQIQAECLIKRLNLRGFHVEKHQASLLLLWQRRELATASVWTC